MPDLHKEIARNVSSKRERDEALQHLRKLYGQALDGTEWEAFSSQLNQEADPIDPDDPIEFYDVEMRAVATVWPDVGMGHAWVWQDTEHKWTYAPGLVNKSWLEGAAYSRNRFVREFSSVDLGMLETLVVNALAGGAEIAG